MGCGGEGGVGDASCLLVQEKIYLDMPFPYN